METENNIQNEVETPAVVETKTGGTLTVVVVDEQSKPVNGAKVSIKPSDASAVTNADGEVQFTLGAATKYEVTASDGSDTVTVPYYVTPNGATRLVINPVYVKTIEAQLHPTSIFVKAAYVGGGIVVAVIIFMFLKKFLRRKKRSSSAPSSNSN